jgi:methionyl-tRNA formyltransferase
VKMKALSAGIPVTQPADLEEAGFLDKLASWNADLFIVVAFRILPRSVFELPPRGTVNVHASLLPKYRGAAPIQWAILRGDRETGVTTFFIEPRVDAGDWILQERTPIGPEENAGQLHDRLALLGAECLLRTVNLIGECKAKRTPQTGEPSTAPKIIPSDYRIRWNEPAQAVVNRIRAFAPKPGAFTEWHGMRIKCFRAQESGPGDAVGVVPGTVINVRDGTWSVAAGKGAVSLLEIQPESGTVMTAADFLRGYRVRTGDTLGDSISG